MMIEGSGRSICQAWARPTSQSISLRALFRFPRTGPNEQKKKAFALCIKELREVPVENDSLRHNFTD